MKTSSSEVALAHPTYAGPWTVIARVEWHGPASGVSAGQAGAPPDPPAMLTLSQPSWRGLRRSLRGCTRPDAVHALLDTCGADQCREAQGVVAQHNRHWDEALVARVARRAWPVTIVHLAKNPAIVGRGLDLVGEWLIAHQRRSMTDDGEMVTMRLAEQLIMRGVLVAGSQLATELLALATDSTGRAQRHGRERAFGALVAMPDCPSDVLKTLAERFGRRPDCARQIVQHPNATARVAACALAGRATDDDEVLLAATVARADWLADPDVATALQRRATHAQSEPTWLALLAASPNAAAVRATFRACARRCPTAAGAALRAPELRAQLGPLTPADFTPLLTCSDHGARLAALVRLGQAGIVAAPRTATAEARHGSAAR
jgi:hypothetical protein